MALVVATSCDHHGTVCDPHAASTWRDTLPLGNIESPRDVFHENQVIESSEYRDDEKNDDEFNTLEKFHLWNSLGPTEIIGPQGTESSSSSERDPAHVSAHQTLYRQESTIHETESRGSDLLLDSRTRGPFTKWMSSLHRRATQRHPLYRQDCHISSESSKEKEKEDTRLSRGHLHCHESSAGSSFGFVAAVRSVSASLASVSSVARSRGNTAASFAHSRTDHSSMAESRVLRISEDSTTAEKPPRLDAAAIERSIQRRRILGEIIATEEGYIADVRFLNNVYITLLASMTSQTSGLRDSIKSNLADIVTLHEEILSELHRLVPYAEHMHVDGSEEPHPVSSPHHGKPRTHRRCRSLDVVPENENSISTVQEDSDMLADPQVAAAVARTFGKRMSRFFIYKEYGAKYEIMAADIDLSSTRVLEWESFRRGLEVLASTVGSAKSYLDSSKKSLSLGDLLMKPIQRICKYPLLFSELLKCTTVVDCPNSHMEVETTLDRLREATAELNQATDDMQVRSTLQRTWLLQDRLVFPQRKLDAVTRNQIRSYGRIHLCGALHVCWSSEDGVKGQYMICLLYNDVLCLALAGKVDQIYTIMACIDLRGAEMATADNGQGMQCHTAPFSWKLVFVHDGQTHELLMSARSAEEEAVWRSHLRQTRWNRQKDLEKTVFSWCDLDVKQLRAAAGSGPEAVTHYVIVKNTSSLKDLGVSSASTSPALSRPPPLSMGDSPVSTLAPSRSDRSRLESLLAEVWSPELLPLGGTGSRSMNEHLVRASSIMRRLSVANLTGSLGRRSGGSIGRKTSQRSAEDSQHTSCESYCMAGSDQDTTIRVSSSDQRVCSERLSTVMRRPRLHASTFVKLPDATTDTGAKLESDQTRFSFCSSTSTGPRQNPTGPRTSTNDSIESWSQRPQGSAEQQDTTEAAEGEDAPAGRPASEGVRPRELSRWAKVGMVKSDGKGHGFRSLFR